MMAGKLATLNHDIHGLAILTPASSANFKHKRFCAAAVRKRALELPDACQAAETNTTLLLVVIKFKLIG